MGTDARMNRIRFQTLISGKKWSAKEFHDRWTKQYGFKIKYNNFMELINNNVSWKLVYALAIAHMLDVDVNELFDFIYTEVEELV